MVAVLPVVWFLWSPVEHLQPDGEGSLVQRVDRLDHLELHHCGKREWYEGGDRR